MCFMTSKDNRQSEQGTSAGETPDTSYALVMKGGGVKGLAYVGAIKELEKYYKFDWFIGTSAGAIAAVLLGVGYNTEEIKDMLSNKNFCDFLDSSIFKLPFNLIFKGGLYEGHAFTAWLDQCISAKIKSFEPLPLTKIPKRVTVYASRRYQSALIFDKAGPRGDTAASFAVRCSMSIPFVFTPQRDQGLRVLDGGMQNNYPVNDLLANNPGTKFIGLYLGNYYEGMHRETSLLREMFQIWTEAVDTEALARYEQDTVVIDPRPISTIDFKLSVTEKDFLLKVGRSSALRFLLNRQLPNGPKLHEVEEAEEQTLQAKAATERIQARKRKRRRLLVLVMLLAMIGIPSGLVYILHDNSGTKVDRKIDKSEARINLSKKEKLRYTLHAIGPSPAFRLSCAHNRTLWSEMSSPSNIEKVWSREESDFHSEADEYYFSISGATISTLLLEHIDNSGKVLEVLKNIKSNSDSSEASVITSIEINFSQ